MKAILCEKPEALRLIDRPEPQRRPGEVLVRIRRVGICGTDYHIYKGNQPYFEYPRVIGHGRQPAPSHLGDAPPPISCRMADGADAAPVYRLEIENGRRQRNRGK